MKTNSADCAGCWTLRVPTSIFTVILTLLLPNLNGGGVASAAGNDVEPTVAHYKRTRTQTGPFPSNRFTVLDASQNTGRRINLPLPDRSRQPSNYDDVRLLNTLDGFNLQPRLSIPFNGAIDVNTVTSATVFLIPLRNYRPSAKRKVETIGINQIVWDPVENVLYAKSDRVLDQHTRYALIVTDGVKDAWGRSVGADQSFLGAVEQIRGSNGDEVRGDNRFELAEAVRAAAQAGVAKHHIVTASVFTTASPTAILEKIRRQIHDATPVPADFRLGPGGIRTVFDFSRVTAFVRSQQTSANPPMFDVRPLNVGVIDIIPGSVGQLAFGKYRSPNYLTAGRFIPPMGTLTGRPIVQSYEDVYFNLYLPAEPKPPAGWPVAIFVAGDNGTKESGNLVAAALAQQGVATITISALGEGFGPLGSARIDLEGDESVTFSLGGRTVDANGDQVFTPRENAIASGAYALLWDRDSHQQNVADLMQLVREIEVGMDADGDGIPDLDRSRIYYFGQSAGGFTGTLFLAIEPNVRVGVINSAGPDTSESGRLSTFFRPTMGAMLAARVPSLLNEPGLTNLGGVPVEPPYFDENLPLRDRPPVINGVAGALPIQEFLENFQWIGLSGAPMSYAPHLRADPLVGVSAKKVIIQFSIGDRDVVNPVESALVRAGRLLDRTTLFRYDLFYPLMPELGTDPHGFLYLFANPALGFQQQIAAFFASDGAEVITPYPGPPFFEVPIVGPLPEDFNFIATGTDEGS